MDKDKMHRKKSLGRRSSLPVPPPEPQPPINVSPSSSSTTPIVDKDLPETIKYLFGYKERERNFLKIFAENFPDKDADSCVSGEYNNSSETVSDSDKLKCEKDCKDFIMPLLNRSGPSVVAALATQDALDQLDKLHYLLQQLLTLKEQNYRMLRNVRNAETLYGLRKIQEKIAHEAINPQEELSDNDELEAEIAQNEGLWDSIWAAGRSATNKRLNSKRSRSKPNLADDIDPNLLKQCKQHYPLRRQSAITDFKAKVSKWTKVKAAFKWEKANVGTFHEGKSSDSITGFMPGSHEIDRYLRVPSIPVAASSGDSAMSSSSGNFLSGGSVPASPGTISSASSMEDVHLSEENKHNLTEHKYRSHDVNIGGRSNSLDGDVIIQQEKNKTTWHKMKNVIQSHSESLKGKNRTRSVKSLCSINHSRDASPCDSTDALSYTENIESNSSSQTSPIIKNNSSNQIMTLNTPITEISCPNSPIGYNSISFSSDDYEGRNEFDNRKKINTKGMRRCRPVREIEVLPEGVPLDLTNRRVCDNFERSIVRRSSPVYKQDSAENEMFEPTTSSPVLHRTDSKWAKVKKAFLVGSSSGPSSPNRHLEFFGDGEDISSGDISEPTTPRKGKSMNFHRGKSGYSDFLDHDFDTKSHDFERSRSITSTGGTKEDSSSHRGSIILSSDLRKKLQWGLKKQQSTSGLKESTGPGISSSSASNIRSKQDGNETKKIDWNLWKTGQLKLEGQGLIQLPDEKDLPEDFQKKLDEWKRLKSSGSNKSDYGGKRSSPKGENKGEDSVHSTKKFDFDKELQKIKKAQHYCDKRDKAKAEDRDKLEKLKLKNKELTVKTIDGEIKFEGISRKFTRKLYEWEKSRGIGPESSTFALLHPGYRPLAVDKMSQKEKNYIESGGFTRSFSMDSISPIPSIPSISRQTSSLSLNDADELKDNTSTDRRISSNPELEVTDSDLPEEPEAVIVEVEDEIEETAAPLITTIPKIEQQTAVYKYEKMGKPICVPETKTTFLNRSNDGQQTIKILERYVSLLEEDAKGIDDFKTLKLHIQLVYDSLNTIPIHARRINSKRYDLIKELSCELITMLNSLRDEDINGIFERVKYLLDHLKHYIQDLIRHFTRDNSEEVPLISITPADLNNQNSRATITFIPEIMSNAVKVHQVHILHDKDSTSAVKVHQVQILRGKESDNQNDYTTQPCTSSKYKEEDKSKKINRSSSNGQKRKVKLRKLGSRQSSKTETESDEDTQNYVMDTPRKCKRKTSRAKKNMDTFDKAEELPPPPPPELDDVVYVLKIKPGQKKSESNMVSESRCDSLDDKILITPTETYVELIEKSSDNSGLIPIPMTTANVFVKKKRKLFTTVNGSSETIVKNLDSSSTSDRNESDANTNEQNAENNKKIMNLPPLPQSPNAHRKIDCKPSTTKEMSPSIRLMIAKYNERISAERNPNSPLSSGSCSPVGWRSPVLDRRVRTQTQKYQEHIIGITKSSSFGNLENRIMLSTLIEKSNSCSEKDPICDVARSVKKSHSAGRLDTQWRVVNIEPEELDSIPTTPELKLEGCPTEQTILGSSPTKKERLYQKKSDTHPIFSQKSGIARKITSTNQREDPLYRRYFSDDGSGRSSSNHPNKYDNSIPKISRKYDSKPSSLKLRPSVTHFEQRVFAQSAPVSPDEQEIKIPLNDRALKLKKAKEEFLQSNKPSAKAELWNNRLSQISIESDHSQPNSNCPLVKSASVGVIGATTSSSEPIVKSSSAHQYDSLPRNTKVQEESKLRNRFGISNIASKLRKVKLRRSSKDLTKMNAVSELCRQSLMVDLIPSEGLPPIARPDSKITETQPSSSTASSFITLKFLKSDKKDSKLLKSKSVGTTLND